MSHFNACAQFDVPASSIILVKKNLVNLSVFIFNINGYIFVGFS